MGYGYGTRNTKTKKKNKKKTELNLCDYLYFLKEKKLSNERCYKDTQGGDVC